MSGEHPSFTNEQEHEQLLTALRESEILRELAELLASSLDLKRILQVLTKRTTEVCQIERCSVWLLADTQEVFRPAAYYLSSQRISHKHIKAADHIWYHGSILFDDDEIFQLLKEKGMLVVDDLYARPKVQAVAETFLVRSLLLVALVREGRIVGMMSLDDPAQIRTFTGEQQQLARAIGQQAALAIDNARLYEQAQAERRRAERLIERAQAINQVALTVNSGETLPVVLEIATHHLVHGLNADDGAIALLEAEQLHLVNLKNYQHSRSNSSSEFSIALADLPSCQQAASTGLPLFVPEILRYPQDDSAAKSELEWYDSLAFHNVMIVPLMVGPSHPTSTMRPQSAIPATPVLPHISHCIGFAFVNYSDDAHRPGKGQIAFAQDIAAQCALAIQKDRLLADVRRAAALATERANTLEAVFQAMTEGITVLNQDGEVLVRNHAASMFLGIPINATDKLQAFLNRYPTYTLHGQPLSYDEFPLARALKGERIRGERFVTSRGDGNERVVEVNVTHMLDEAKNQIGLVSAFRDITTQTRAEQRIRQALETMLNIAEAVSGITDIKDILHSVLNLTLIPLHCAHGSVHLYDEELDVFTPLLCSGFADQKAESEWLAEQLFWLSPATNQYQGFRKQLMEGHATVINAEQYPVQPNPFSQTMLLSAPITYRHRILGLMILERLPSYQQKGLSNRDGKQEPPREFSIWDMAVIEAITQLAGLAIEQARWQQEAINARLSEAAMRQENTVKDEFMAITAHEFRSPLTVILTTSQIGLRALRKGVSQGVTPETIQRVIEGLIAIEAQTHQLTNIVKTFLEATQLNRGQLTINKEPVDLVEIIKQVVQSYNTTSAKHSICTNIAESKYPYLVMGDSARLSQILVNLIENAIKYSQHGGPITITLCQRQISENNAHRSIEVCVEDKGIGIPSHALQHLFERFYRAPNVDENKTKGIGLGLYIVAELLLLHGGNIRAESSGVPGEGSRFILTLPALESDFVESERTSELAS